jgi:hypothetical protein
MLMCQRIHSISLVRVYLITMDFVQNMVAMVIVIRYISYISILAIPDHLKITK